MAMEYDIPSAPTDELRLKQLICNTDGVLYGLDFVGVVWFRSVEGIWYKCGMQKGAN